MLVLSRKPGEQVALGNGITLTVVEVKGNRVRLAFDAPTRSASCGPSSPAGRITPSRPTWKANRIEHTAAPTPAPARE
jgi:hypothetical protein